MPPNPLIPPVQLARSAPEPADGACSTSNDPPLYLRIAKTGSTSVLGFLRRSNCIQRGHLKRSTALQQDEIPERAMRQGQRTVVVLREPCARARSTLAWWPRVTLDTHPAHNLSTLREFAAFAAALPGRYPRAWSSTAFPRQWGVGVAWEQSRYVNSCTEVLCLGAPELQARLQRLCRSSLPLPRLNQGEAAAATAGSSPGAEEECALIRTLYARDDWLWRRHCGAGTGDA